MKAPNTQEQRADARYIPVRGRKERKAMLPGTISGVLNESPFHRHRVKGKRNKCKHSKLKVRSSMKVVHALNAPDVRHEITLLEGVWEPPAQGKGGINRKAPRKGGVSRGVRGVLHQGQKGNSSMEPR